MSEPKRYTDLQVWEALHFAGSTNGWIRWDDYARLKAEVERLRASSFVTAVPVEHYARVVKAGDAVALDYAERIEIEAGETAKTLMKTLPVLRDWTAAKEGKPSV